jgi:CRISPR/Cas system endoribonuclease Cas6 (RAMP superfamily)
LSSITSFTFRIAIDKNVTFQSFSGFASCGIFYNLIKSVDEDFAEKLHSSKKLAPFSVTPFFIENIHNKIVYRNLPAPSIASISFSIMDNKLCDIFREVILKQDLYVDLINFKAKVISIAVNTYKFSDFISNEPLASKFTIKFLTPTSFRHSIFNCCPECPYYHNYIIKIKKGEKIEKQCKYAIRCDGMLVPLPIPSLMFRNIARIWSRFSDVHLDIDNAIKWAENAITIAGFPNGIRTVRLYEHPTTNKWIVGFTGTVRFSIREYNERYAKILAALIKMAELTNVGVRRTAGFGMIKYFAKT